LFATQNQPKKLVQSGGNLRLRRPPRLRRTLATLPPLRLSALSPMTPPLAASPAPYQRFPTPHAAVRHAPPRPSKLRRRSSALGAPTGAAPSDGRRCSIGRPTLLPRAAGSAPCWCCSIGWPALLPRAACTATTRAPPGLLHRVRPRQRCSLSGAPAPAIFVNYERFAAGRLGPLRGNCPAPVLGVARPSYSTTSARRRPPWTAAWASPRSRSRCRA
jgi:hypothetical protein